MGLLGYREKTQHSYLIVLKLLTLQVLLAYNLLHVSGKQGGGGSPAFCRHCSKSASAAAAKSGKKQQALLNEGYFRILGKTCLFRLKTQVKIV